MHAENAALPEYQQVLAAFTDLILDGIVPLSA